MRDRLQEIRDAIATVSQAEVQKPLNMIVDLLEYRLDEHFNEQLTHNVANLHAGLMRIGEEQAHECSTPDAEKSKGTSDTNQEQVS